MRIALDATAAAGGQLTGVGVYAREILHGLAALDSSHGWLWCYRSQAWVRSLRERRPPGVRWRPLLDGWTPRCQLFHGLNQRLPRSMRGRAVATFHDLFVITGNYSEPDFRARFERQAREAAASADRVIAVSRFTANQVRDLLRVDESRITVIPHGVRQPAPRVARDPRPWVLCVGAMQRRKNTIRIVEAFEQAPRAERLILAGPVSGFDAASALERIKDSPRRGDIEVTGWVDQAVLEELYARAAVFAFPSLDEGFGMPVLDAMARGVAVVTSNCSALPEVAGDAALLVDPEDSSAIAGAITRLMESDSLQAELTARGFARSREFTWARAVASTLEVYRSLRR